MVHSTTKFIEETSTSLNIPLDVVTKVISHHFSCVDSYLTFPTHSAYKIPMGTLRFTKLKLHDAILYAIRKYRKNPSKKLYDSILFLFRNRTALTEYEASRQFKRRFKTWHYK